ncbi:hypothetical protein D3C71_1456670 [compost metagenome]
MQPQQRGQATDRRNFRPKIAAYDIGINHCLFNYAFGIAAVNRQGPHQHRRHVVHHRGQKCRQETGAQRSCPNSAFGQKIKHTGQGIGQPCITQPVDHQIHPEREDHDLPGGAPQHFSSVDGLPLFRHQQQDQRTNGGDQANRHAQRLKPKKPHQQQRQYAPTGSKRRQIANGLTRWPQQPQVIAARNVLAEEQVQHHQRGDNGGKVHRHHHRRILRETQLKEISGDDIHQIGHHQRQAGGIGDKSRRHHEGQRCP